MSTTRNCTIVLTNMHALATVRALAMTLIVLVSGDTDAHRVWSDKALRYTGFRFEIAVNQEFDFKSLIQSRAEMNFCFGWIQDSPRGTLVGEARCKKDAGKKMIEFITALSSDDKSNIRVYEDSLIRLHPSSFKVMPEGRNTCFREEPHKCSHLYFQGEDGTAFHDR